MDYSKSLRHLNPRETVTRVEKSLVTSWATQDRPAGHEFDTPGLFEWIRLVSSKEEEVMK